MILYLTNDLYQVAVIVIENVAAGLSLRWPRKAVPIRENYLSDGPLVLAIFTKDFMVGTFYNVWQ